MVFKTIDLLNTAFLMGSMAAAVPVSIYKPTGPAFIAWIILIFLSGLWELYTLKMPRPSGNSGQGHMKNFYDISLADGTVKVNGKNI
ncbi:hypothetical protein [Frisingicoccus sp.]|uniref:hypothetical protein n=1 Tax=Frisingicoccus sp. TaxID=1918627 RepID=UPI003AB5AF99